MSRLENIKIENENFSQNVITLHILGLDCSGSMEGEKEKAVRNTLQIIQETLLSLEEISSTRVAIIRFGDYVYPSNLEVVEKFSTKYSHYDENTALYDTIVYIKNQVKLLHEQYREKYRLIVNVVILSDGQNNIGSYDRNDAQEAVEILKNELNASTIFYAIEDNRELDALTRKAKSLGFDVKTVGSDKESMMKMSRQLSHMLQTSSKNGTLATLNSAVSVSTLASAEFQKKMEEVQVDTFDPFADVFS